MKWAIAIACIAAPAGAQIRPMAIGSDPTQQQVQFAENQTVVIEVALNGQATISFAPGEQLRSTSVGREGYWQVDAPLNASALIVRPLAGADTTDLSVVTDRRVYNLLLVARDSMTGEIPLAVRFVYRNIRPLNQMRIGAITAPALYRIKGHKAAQPLKVSDDGFKTYVEWSAQQDLSAVFSIDAEGNEALLNGFFRDGRFVIDAIYPKLIFHLDGRTASAERVSK